jgi:hypothetical protein
LRRKVLLLLPHSLLLLLQFLLLLAVGQVIVSRAFGFSS